MSRWGKLLQPEERIVWQGRPAPRAFTFRNWRWSLLTVAGLVVLLLVQAGAKALSPSYCVDSWLLGWMLALGMWGVVGHLVWARLEWEQVFYLLTDRRLLAVSGIRGRRCRMLSVAEVQRIEPCFLGAALATVTVVGGGRRLILHGLEYPQLLLQPLSSLAKAGAPSHTDALGQAEEV